MTIKFTGGIVPTGEIQISQNQAPVWSSPANLGSNHESETITESAYAVIATDVDVNDTLIYSLLDGTLPTGATLNANGTITGPAVTVTIDTTYNFTARVYDGTDSVDMAFSITVNENANPTWSGGTGAALGSVDENTSVNILLTAVDSDGLPMALTYSKVAGTLPSGISLSSGGLLSGTAPTVSSDTDYMFTIRADDGDKTADRLFTLTVTNVLELPLTISGLGAWYDVQDSSTITESGGFVSRWNNKGPGSDLISSSGQYPVLVAGGGGSGRPGIQFVSSVDNLRGGQASIDNLWNNGGYVICVVKSSSVDGARIFDGGENWHALYQNLSGSNSNLRFRITSFSGSAGDWQDIGFNHSSSTRTLVEIEYTSNNVSNTPIIRKNGADRSIILLSTPSGTTSNSNQLMVFGGGVFRGWIFEVLIYNQIPSNAEKTSLRNFLNSRWGL